MKSFASDYRCKPHPAVVQAVVDACAYEPFKSYGDDHLTASVQGVICDLFGLDELYTCYVSNGTAANRLALQTLLTRPYMSVLCTEVAHINTFEGGAIESLGYKLRALPGEQGKLRWVDLNRVTYESRDVHVTTPTVISLSNATEVGTIYSDEEVEEICAWAVNNDCIIHIDGARLANAAAKETGAILLKTLMSDEAVSAITLGGTKIGGMFGEVVVFKDSELYAAAMRLQKQQGQLHARSNLIAAQICALYAEDLWLTNARQANAMAVLLAQRVEKELGFRLVYPVETNAVFVELQPNIKGRIPLGSLPEETNCYVWEREASVIRWMCAWDTTEEDVNQFVRFLKEVRKHD